MNDITDRKTQHKIVQLMGEYFDLDDKEKDIRQRRFNVRDKLLSITNPGRYGKGVVYKVKEKEIHVKSYIRSGFTAIRRAKRNGQ